MLQKKTGISDMAFYLPPQRMSIEELIRHRSQSVPGLSRHLERAQRVTGQQALHFPEANEDPATMAAEAAHRLLQQLSDTGFSLAKLRYLVAGTESGLDHSKPLSAAISGMLVQAGVTIPATLSSFQVQHACAGATLAAISVAALLSGYGREGETGLVVASDIARYPIESTAELTQGAGAAALLIANDPELVELDLSTMGFASADVDDFFRPLGSVVAQVNGRYSMECYNQALETAFLDHANRSNQSPAELLHNSDIIVLHAPFARMPIEAMTRLLGKQLGLSAAAAEEFLAAKTFHQGLAPVAEIGNTYTASVFFVLAWALRDLYRDIGRAIVGKRLFLASYGSGNTMVVLTATVAVAAPDVIARWDLDEDLRQARNAEWNEYSAWAAEGYGSALPETGRRSKDHGFRLAAIRPDGYRGYEYRIDPLSTQEDIKAAVIARA